jgi:flagellar M-ring protein FliF
MALLPVSRQTLESARGRSRAALAGFTTGQKVVTVLAVVGVVVGGVVFMHAESKPSYQPLFTNLQASDSGAVTAQLTSSKIPYQLSDGGATILVPAADVDQERVALAEQGLPDSGTVGFSNLEKSGITTSEFVQQVEYQQALEGQLEQTIESIQGVQSAQVNLVVPQQSDFAIGSQPATTASILVDLTPGTSLSSGQVQAIVHLAASATPGLSASNVTVVDNQGDVLSSPGGTTGGSGSSNTQQTDAYDTQLSNSVEDLLNRVVGVGNSAVQVHALLNFNQVSTTTKGLQTDAKGQPITAPTSQTSSTDTYNGSGTPPSGVLGSGQPTTATTSSGSGNYSTTSTQVTNAVGQVNQTVQQAPGQVEKTSIAVLLNSDGAKKVSDAQVKDLVTAAAGLNIANGDQLAVTSMPFASSATQSTALAKAAAAADRRQLIVHGAEVAGLVLLIIGMLFFALRAARRRSSYDEVQIPELVPLRSQMMPIDDEPHPTGELPAVPRTPALGAVPDAVLSQVNGYIEQRPAEAARLLRAWADERSTEPV